MKKTLKLALCGLMLAGATNAQVVTLPNGEYDYERGILPKAFSSDGKSKFLATEKLGEDSNIKIHTYNSSFNVEHSFEVISQNISDKTITELRAAVATPGDFITIDPERREMYVPWNQASQEKKIEYLKQNRLQQLLNYYVCNRDSIYTDADGKAYIYLINDNKNDAEKIICTCVFEGDYLVIILNANSQQIDSIYFGNNAVVTSWDQASQEEKIAWLRQEGRHLLRDDIVYYIDWERDSIYTSTNGDVYMYLIKRDYDYSADYEVERAIGAFVLNGETLKFQPINYLRTGEWEVVDTEEYEYENDMTAIWNVINIDNDWSYELSDPLLATQTLFNTDAKYEYIRYKQVAYTNQVTSEWDTDGDAIPDKRTVRSGYDYAGLEVVSEDGNVIASFDVGDTEGKYLILWEGKRYLMFGVYNESNYNYQIYEINPNGNNITRVSSQAFMHILPAMPRKNTSVTVEFGEESVKNGGQLMITDMSGRTVYRNAVAPGETSVQVPLRRMASGVYNVTLVNGGQRIEGSKLIVR